MDLMSVSFEDPLVARRTRAGRNSDDSVKFCGREIPVRLPLGDLLRVRHLVHWESLSQPAPPAFGGTLYSLRFLTGSVSHCGRPRRS